MILMISFLLSKDVFVLRLQIDKLAAQRSSRLNDSLTAIGVKGMLKGNNYSAGDTVLVQWTLLSFSDLLF